MRLVARTGQLSAVVLVLALGLGCGAPPDPSAGALPPSTDVTSASTTPSAPSPSSSPSTSAATVEGTSVRTTGPDGQPVTVPTEPPLDEPPLDEPPLDEPPLDEPPLDEPPLVEQPSRMPPVVSTDDPLPTTDLPVVGPRTVQYAGPTLEGSYGQAPFQFSVEDEIQCGSFDLGKDLPADRADLTITSVEVRDQKPAGSPVFAHTGSDEEQEQRVACAQDTPIEDCVGTEFNTTDAGEQLRCVLTLTFLGSDVDRTAGLAFRFEAQCTDTTPFPCDEPEIVAEEPSAESPVVAVGYWPVEETLVACPKNPSDSPGDNCPGY